MPACVARPHRDCRRAAGIGKTALVSRLMLDARRRGAAYAIANCRASSFPTPYAPWIELIDGLRLARVVPEKRWHSLPRLVPSLAGTSARSGSPTESSRCPTCRSTNLRATRDGGERTPGRAGDRGSGTRRPGLVGRLRTVGEALRRLTRPALPNGGRVVRRRCARPVRDCATPSRGSPRGNLSPDDVRQWVGDLFADPATADACATHLARGGTLIATAGCTYPACAGGSSGLASRTEPGVPSTRTTSRGHRRNRTPRRARSSTGLLSPKTRAILGELPFSGMASRWTWRSPLESTTKPSCWTRSMRRRGRALVRGWRGAGIGVRVYASRGRACRTRDGRRDAPESRSRTYCARAGAGSTGRTVRDRRAFRSIGDGGAGVRVRAARRRAGGQRPGVWRCGDRVSACARAREDARAASASRRARCGAAHSTGSADIA